MSAPVTGTVTPPDDLQPAIDALGPRGKQYLLKLQFESGTSEVTPDMLAQSADYERGELRG